MKRILLFLAILLVPVLALAQNNRNEIVKTGWNIGLLPAFRYDNDLGFQFGALSQLYHYGDGSDYPNYRHKVMAVASVYSRGAKQFSLVRFLLEMVQDETMPVDVEGNIQWGVNKTTDGWLVWLMNADGVEKFRGERQRIDLSRTSVVNVRMKSGAPANVTDARTGLGVPTVGGAFQVNVMPGEWRIFKVTNK